MTDRNILEEEKMTAPRLMRRVGVQVFWAGFAFSAVAFYLQFISDPSKLHWPSWVPATIFLTCSAVAGVLYAKGEH